MQRLARVTVATCARRIDEPLRRQPSPRGEEYREIRPANNAVPVEIRRAAPVAIGANSPCGEQQGKVRSVDCAVLIDVLGRIRQGHGRKCGCRVETPRQAVDATVQTRWRTALAALGRDDAWIEA